MNNKKDEAILKVYDAIITTDDLRSFYNEVDHFIRSLYQIDEPFEKNLNASFNLERKEAILKFLKSKNVEEGNQVQIQEKMTELKKEGEVVPVVTLKLAYDPTREHLESFSNWFLTRIKRKVFLEILVERTLLGGAYITYKGFFKDYSIKTRLQDVFKDKDFTKQNSNLKVKS